MAAGMYVWRLVSHMSTMSGYEIEVTEGAALHMHPRLVPSFLLLLPQ